MHMIVHAPSTRITLVSGLTSTCKRIKCITLVYATNPDSIRVQPTSGLLNLDWDPDQERLHVPGLAYYGFEPGPGGS